MKKNFLLFLSIILLIGISGCNKVSEITEELKEVKIPVKIPYSTQLTLPDSLPILENPIPIATPSTDTESALKNLGHNLNKVERIEIEKFDLVLNAPEGGDLNFFNTIQIFIVAEGLDEVLLAEKTVPESEAQLAQISLDCKNTDILAYFKKPEFTLRALVTTDRVVTEKYVIDAKSVFRVDVKILGQL